MTTGNTVEVVAWLASAGGCRGARPFPIRWPRVRRWKYAPHGGHGSGRDDPLALLGCVSAIVLRQLGGVRGRAEIHASGGTGGARRPVQGGRGVEDGAAERSGAARQMVGGVRRRAAERPRGATDRVERGSAGCRCALQGSARADWRQPGWAAQSPSVAVAPSAAFVRNSGNTSVSSSTLNPPATGLYTLPVDLSYTKSTSGAACAGASRRRATARRRERRRSTDDCALSLQAELAFDYFELRSADAQRRLLDAAVAAFTEALQLTTNRFEGGAASRSDVAQAKTQLEATRVQATDVAVQRARYEHAIATLLGAPPSAITLAGGAARCRAAGDSSRAAVAAARAASGHRVGRAPRSRGPTSAVGIARTSFFPAVMLSALGGSRR